MQPYPAVDQTRKDRIISDVCELMHDNSDAAKSRAERWLTHVLNHCASEREWWFLQNVVNVTVNAGEDVLDFTGHILNVAAVFVGKRLELRPLSLMTEWRSRAVVDKLPNAGKPTAYSLEAGRRMHLWPAPDQAFTVSVLYQRAMMVEIVPEQWETLLLDGIIGLFGRHFDRDALTQDASLFEQRFYANLRKLGREHNDLIKHRTYDDAKRTGSILSNTSSGWIQQPRLSFRPRWLALVMYKWHWAIILSR